MWKKINDDDEGEDPQVFSKVINFVKLSMATQTRSEHSVHLDRLYNIFNLAIVLNIIKGLGSSWQVINT